MIKQILFDCGGVFVEIQYHQLIEKITGDAKLADLFMERIFTPESPWPKNYDCGTADTAECGRQLKEFFPEIKPEHIDVFMEEWIRWLIPFPEMETMVDELHEAGYKCYLLSNFAERFPEFRNQYCPAIQHLDGEVISYQVHLLKPGREIFDYTTQKFGYDPAETLFVDDTLHNVEGAQAAGYQTYHYTTPAAFRAYLKEQNILS